MFRPGLTPTSTAAGVAIITMKVIMAIMVTAAIVDRRHAAASWVGPCWLRT
jgi:hypothetical protein